MSKYRSISDIFGESQISTDAEKIVLLKVRDIDFYYEQKTRMYPDDELLALSEEIKNEGLIHPIVVRTMEPDEKHQYKWYQVLDGRNRLQATRLAELDEIKAIITDCDDDRAAYIVSTTTINQRQNLLPSEKAYAYKMQRNSLCKQGKRTDLTSRQNVDKLVQCNVDSTSRQNVGKLNVEPRETVIDRKAQRYIRLTYLISSLLELVDDNVLTFGVGVNLSYLTTDEQEIIDAYLSENKVKISVEQSENIKKYSKEIAPITYAVLNNMFKPAKTVKPTERKLKFSKPMLNKVWSYIPSTLEDSEVNEYILTALEYYQQRRKDTPTNEQT